MEIPLFSKRRLKAAYDRVFSDALNSNLDAELVLNDIYSRTYVNKPIGGDSLTRAEQEGKRQIGINIQNMLNLDVKHFTELDVKMKRKAKELKL